MWNRLSQPVFVMCLIGTLLCVFTPDAVYSDKGNVGINFNVLSPQGEFRKNVDRNGYGFSLEGFYKPLPIPIKFGLHFGYSQYGKDERREYFSPDIPEVNVEVETTNNILLFLAAARLQKEIGWLSPFCEGLVGLQYLFTESSVNDTGYNAETPIATTKNFDDTAGCYGAGAGFMITLYSFENTTSKRPIDGKLKLDFNVRYIRGGKAEYLKKGSITRDNGKLIYDIQKSKTDMLYFQAGLVFSF